MKEKQKKTKKKHPEKPEFNLEDANPHVKVIEEYLKNLKFKKHPFRGILEKDVWKAIAKLNELYDNALISERHDAFEEELTEDGISVL